MSRFPRSSKDRYGEYLRKRKTDEREKKSHRKNAAPGAKKTDWTQAPEHWGLRRANRSAWALIKEMLRLVRGHYLQVAYALSALLVTVGVGLVTPLSTKVVVDYIILDTPGPTGIPAWMHLPTDRVTLLWIVAGTLVALTAMAAIVGTWGRYHMTRLTKVVQVTIRRRVFDHLSRLPLHKLQALKSGGVTSILRDDAGLVGEMLFSVFYNPTRALLTFIGGLVALSLIDWRMLVGGLMLVPAVWLSHRTWIGRIRPVHREVRQNRTIGDAHATETFGGIRVVRAFGRRRGESGRFSRNNNLIAREEMLVWWWSRIVETTWYIFIPLATAAVLIYGGTQVLHGKLTIGDVTAFTAYLLMLLGPLDLLVGTSAALQNGLAGFDRCLDVLAEPTELSEAAMAAPGGPIVLQPEQVRGGLNFENVSFAYPNNINEQVLTDISFEAQPGQTIALVGVSGSGKSTLCNLVARFFDPTKGRILLDGVDLRSIDIESYRALLGIVEQDVFLFDGTVSENIGYGRRHASAEAIQAAAVAANADEFVGKLEKKYDTIIGERGVRLSGGQKQRIAIARALLADPRILILDEATSNLDSESESLIQQALAVLMKGRTCFVIAHRLGTIRNADRIVVLEKGRIVESGTHTDLLAQQGRYFEMLSVQLHAARDYAAASGPANGSGNGARSAAARPAQA